MKDLQIKKYHIDSFEKLCNVVNNENIERILPDLAQWLVLYADALNNLRIDQPKLCKDKTNWQLAKGAFIWHDDGKNDFKGITLHNESTGEITNINP